MTGETIIKRLPKDVQICSYGDPMKIGVAITLETVDHALALRQAIDLAIIPLLELDRTRAKIEAAGDRTEPTKTAAEA